MFGLNLDKITRDHAVFATVAGTERAFQRLAFGAHTGMKAKRIKHHERGEMKGYKLMLFDGNTSHIITETDVERFVG